MNYARGHSNAWRLNFHRLTVDERREFLRVTHQGKITIGSIADLGKVANLLSRVMEKWPFKLNPHSAMSYLLLSDSQIDELCAVISTEVEHEESNRAANDHIELHTGSNSFDKD